MKITAIILLLSLVVPQKIKFVKVNLNDEITVRLPKEFSPMTLEDQEQRVYSYRKALALYTSLDRSTEFGANISYSKFKSEDIQLMKEFYKSNIMNLYTDVEFLEEDVVNIDGRNYAVFEFTSLVMDIDSGGGGALTPISKYTYIAYTIANRNTYLFHLSAPIRQQQQWAPIAQQIVSSIRIKGK